MTPARHELTSQQKRYVLRAESNLVLFDQPDQKIGPILEDQGVNYDKIVDGSDGMHLRRIFFRRISIEDYSDLFEIDDELGEPAFVMTVREGVAYWATDKGLLTSTDQGKSWSVTGGSVSCVHGPYWGKKADHVVVVGKAGFHESTDGGKTWKIVAPLPDGFKVGGVGPNYAWDPVHDVFYASSMGKDTFRWTR